MNLPWNEQLSAIRKRLRLDQNAMGRRLGVSREWVSKLEKGREVPSEEIQRKTADLAREARLHFAEPEATNVGLPSDHSVSGPKAKNHPSGQQDCENYFQALIEAALKGGNPNAFPVIHDRLQKKFPLSEWAEPDLDTEFPLHLPITKHKYAEAKAELKSKHSKVVEYFANKPTHPEP